MGYHLITADREQMFLLPPTLSEWLTPDHLVYQVLDAVELFDTTPFLRCYNPDGIGQAAFDPRIMLAILLYGYCIGERSSRRLERRCQEDIAFRVAAGNHQPHFTTIARFRREHEDALKSLFVKVLELCRKAGMVKLGKVAIDGTKIMANASIDANRQRAWLEEEVAKMLAEAEAVDRTEDAQHGSDRHGDEIPEALRDRRKRLAKLQAAKNELDDEQRTKDLEFAERLAERERQERERGKKRRGRKPQAPPVDEKQSVNLTDPQSRIMKDRRGFLQGYNAQAVVSEDQIILAAEITQQANDVQQLESMLARMEGHLKEIGESGVVGTVLADAGYWSEENVTGVAGLEYDLLIATRNRRREREALRKLGPPRGRIPDHATPRERMERRLRTKKGRTAYARRGVMVEPVFGHIKEGRRGRRFMRRGVEACSSEWKLMAIAHNLCKLHVFKTNERRQETGKAIKKALKQGASQLIAGIRSIFFRPFPSFAIPAIVV